MFKSKQLTQPYAPFLDHRLERRMASRTYISSQRSFNSPMTPTCSPKGDLSKHKFEVEVEVQSGRFSLRGSAWLGMYTALVHTILFLGVYTTISD